MKTNPFVLRALNVNSQEAMPVLYMFLLSFFMGFTLAVYTAVSGTQFLLFFDASYLPVMYIISGLCCSLFNIVYTLLEKRISNGLLFSVLLILFAFFQLLFRVLLYFPAKPVIAALFVSKDIIILLFAFIFYRLMNTVFTIRQGKRLYGLSSSGEIVAGVFGGIMVSLVVPFLGSGNLLLITAGSTLVVLLFFRLLLRSVPSVSLEKAALSASASGGKKRSIRGFFSFLLYPGLIFFFSALLGMGYFFFENLFYLNADRQFLNETSLASFIGIATAIISLVTFFGKIILSDRIVIHYGIRLPLVILPASGLLFALLFKGASLFTSPLIIMFSLTTFSYIGYTFLKDSISQSGMMVLYQPFAGAARHRMQIAINRSGTFFASICFFVITTFSGSEYQLIAYGMFAIFILAGGLAYLLHRAYKNELKKALSARNLSAGTLALDHSAGQVVLENALSGSNPGEIIYALMITEHIYSTELDSFITALLAHPNEIVRQKAAGIIERKHIKSALGEVKKLLAREKSDSVLGKAVKTAMALGKSSMIGAIVPFLNRKNVYIKRGAIAGLIRYGGIEGTLIAGTRLLKMIGSSHRGYRLAAARILRDIGITNFYQPLEKLLGDENTKVRKEALKAAAKLKSNPLWPLVIENLGIAELREQAVKALIAGGRDTLLLLEKEYHKEGLTLEVKKAVITIYGRTSCERSFKLLVKKLSETNRELIHRTISSLHTAGFIAGPDSLDTIDRTLEDEVARASWLNNSLAALNTFNIPDNPDSPPDGDILLKSALTEELEQSKQSILYLLSFIKSSGTVIMAGDKIFNARGEKKMYALELFDTTLPPSLRPAVMKLFTGETETSPGGAEGEPNSGLPMLLEQIIETTLSWEQPAILASALFFSAFLKPSISKDKLLKIALSPEHELSILESAVFALNRLYPALLRKHQDTFVNHREKSISIYIMNKMSSFSSETVHYTIIEKALFLKKSMLFSSTQVANLLSIAPFLSETSFVKNQIPIKEGSPGSSLYIITKGKLQIYNNKATRNETLGEADVFGELSMLDSGPQGYSVKILAECRLFSLERERFFAILTENDTILESVLKVLCSRLLSLTEREDVQNIHYNTVPAKKEQDKKEIILPVEKMMLLQTLPYFKGLSHRTLYKLASMAGSSTFEAGQTLIKAGTKNEDLSFFIIYSGSAVLKDGTGSTNLYKGSYFGELRLFSGREFPAEVTCLEKMFVLRFDKKRLLNSMKEHTGTARSFLAGLVSHIRKLS